MLNPSKRFSQNVIVAMIRKRLFILAVGFVLFCLFCSIYLYSIEIIPHFIILSIPPPDYYQGEIYGDWSRKIRLVYDDTSTRYYLYREETIVNYDPAHGIESWQSVVEYFDAQMEKRGWVRTEKYLPCRRFLPEADFISEGEDGFVYYLQEENNNLYNYDSSGFACLAIWGDQVQSDEFHIVFQTINPSFFTELMSLFSL